MHCLDKDRMLLPWKDRTEEEREFFKRTIHMGRHIHRYAGNGKWERHAPTDAFDDNVIYWTDWVASDIQGPTGLRMGCVAIPMSYDNGIPKMDGTGIEVSQGQVFLYDPVRYGKKVFGFVGYLHGDYYDNRFMTPGLVSHQGVGLLTRRPNWAIFAEIVA